MCGICGQVDPTGVSPADIETMLRTLVHRGPDDEGIYVGAAAGLGSRRLSIIDVAGGRQPMSNESGTIWLVHNGEIYNYQELRHELEQRGHAFRTVSDTEVILHLYEELGERCVAKLGGMFAFALWDAPQQKLLLARDRLGQKPLFYAHDGEQLVFGSEIKAVLAAGGRPRELDHEALHHFLSLRFIPSPRTMLRHVRKLPPAHFLVFQNGAVAIRRYWELSFEEKLDLSDGDFLDGLRHALGQAVASHLVSDVPIGAFLSGGLDSSMIVALLARDLGHTVPTFAVGVREQSFNELPYARAVAGHCQTRHVEEVVESGLIRLLPRMIWHLDEPSDPIAACQYHAAGLAAGHVKVVLGGDGGDELFGGFDRYRGLDFVDSYARLPAVLRRGLLGPVLERLADSFAYKNLTQRARWLHHLSALSSPAERYAEATCFFRFNHAQKEALFSPELWGQVGHLNSADVIARPYNDAPAQETLDRMLYADYMTRLPEHSLMLADRMTMAHGLELRSPYLDHHLVTYLAAFPARLKINGRRLKYIFRELAAGYLPPAIVRRPKHGFMFPVAYWFRNELYPLLEQFLLDSDLIRDGLFRRQAVASLLQSHRAGRADHHVRLWMLLNLELWRRLYLADESVAALTEQLDRLLAPVPRLARVRTTARAGAL